MSIMSEAEGISRQMRGDYSHFLTVLLRLKQTQPSIYKWKQVQLLRYLSVEEECCCVSECNHHIFLPPPPHEGYIIMRWKNLSFLMSSFR